MSETTNTTLSPEDAEVAAKLQKQLEVSHKAAEAIVNLFDETTTTFKRAKAIVSWLDKGADVKMIASELSVVRARKQFPGASEDDIKFYAEQLPSKGGVKVADTTIRAYVNAWASVEASGLVPTEALVNAAFKVMSKGRTSEPRKKLEKQVKDALDAGDIQPEEAERVFIEGCRSILTGRLKAEPREGRPEGNRKKAPIVDLAEVAETIEAGEVPMSAEVAAHTIRAIASRTWSEEDKPEIAAALVEALETLAAEPVEV